MKTSLVLVYNSFDDPLFKGNLLLHIKEESFNNRFRFLIITFEQEKYFLGKKKKAEIQSELKKQNIYWFPLKWHSGKFILIKKAFDIFNSLLLILKLHFKFRPSSIISLGTIAGSFSHMIKLLFSYTHFAYQHEPHSEFMIDFNIWSKSSFSFKLLNFFERKITINAEIISTGTDAMINRIKKLNRSSSVFKLPSCVKEDQFIIENNYRTKIRHELNITDDQKAFIYVGKFGGIYHTEELFILLNELKDHFHNSYFIILSPDPKEWIIEQLKKYSIKNYYVNGVPLEDIPKYLNAADLGISSIPGYKSQKYRSPIKVGEYLLCGIPYITCEGVSEDDIIAKKYAVGIVLEKYTKEDIQKKLGEINNIIFKNDRIFIRNVGIHYRGFHEHKKISKLVFNQLYEK